MSSVNRLSLSLAARLHESMPDPVQNFQKITEELDFLFLMDLRNIQRSGVMASNEPRPLGAVSVTTACVAGDSSSSGVEPCLGGEVSD
ncbi:hypothetical protein NQZ68_035822 [Dissostichus eleginoides]|nr:hypothetical protein NQZ68_035822 [Dissostichus eleginoides]